MRDHKPGATVAGTAIQEFTDAGLFYTNENGERCFLDFSLCYQRYLAQASSPERLARSKELNHWSDEDLPRHVEQLAAWKEVAERNVLGEPWGTKPYIEFHTDPPLRFVFGSEEEFSEARRAIEQRGWRTLDLS